MLEPIIKQIAEGKNAWLIFISCLLVFLFNVNNIYDFLDRISKRRLLLIKEFLGDKGVNGTTKDAVQEELNSQAFQYATGIRTNRDVREKIINIYKITNGRISYSDFRRAYRFLVNQNGKLSIRINLFDRFLNILGYAMAFIITSLTTYKI